MSVIRVLTDAEAANPAYWMPAPEAYLAVAEHLHNGSDLCAANYYRPFDECDLREADINDAINLLRALYRDGWALARTAQGSLELGL